MRKSLTIEQVKVRCLDRGFELIDVKYSGSLIKHSFKCLKHNEIHSMVPSQLFRGSGPKCCGEEKINIRLKSQRPTIKNAKRQSLENGFKFLGTLMVVSAKQEFKCIKHSEVHLSTLDRIRRGKGLKCCGIEKLKITQKNRKLTTKEVKERTLEKGFEFIDNEYAGNQKNHLYRCLKHNDVYPSRPSNIFSGHRLPCCKKEKRSGKNHPNWNLNLTDKQRRSRHSDVTDNWKNQIKASAKRTCFACKKVDLIGRNCIAHHVESYRANPDLINEFSNGACLCLECHINFHKQYGYGNNTRLQFEKFLEEYDDNSKSLNYHKIGHRSLRSLP